MNYSDRNHFATFPELTSYFNSHLNQSVENAGVHLSSETMKETSSLEKKTVMYDKQVRTKKAKD